MSAVGGKRTQEWNSPTRLSFDGCRLRLVLNGAQPVIVKIAVTVGIMTEIDEPLLVNDGYRSSVAANNPVGNEGAPRTARVDRGYSGDVRDLLPRQVQEE